MFHVAKSMRGGLCGQGLRDQQGSMVWLEDFGREALMLSVLGRLQGSFLSEGQVPTTFKAWFFGKQKVTKLPCREQYFKVTSCEECSQFS